MRLAALYLGNIEFGKLSVFISLATLIAFPLSFGLPTYLIRKTQYINYSRFKSYLHTQALFIVMVMSFITFLFICIRSSFLDSDIYKDFLLATTIICLSYALIREGIQRANHRVLKAVIPEWIIKPCTFLILLFIFKPINFSASAELWVLSLFVSFIIGLILNAKDIYWTHFFSLKIKGTISLIYKGSPFLVASGVTLLNNHLDIIMIAELHSDGEAGIYRVNFMVAQFILLLCVSMTAVKTPRFAKLFATKQLHILSLETRKIARISSLIVVPLFLMLILFPNQLIEFLYSSLFKDPNTLRILAFTYMFDALCGCKAGMLNMSNNEKIVLIVSSLSLFFNLILNYFFIPSYGAEGAAIATLITVIFNGCTLVFYNYYLLGVRVHV
jgi:O-antigen/teichoic acid export membrane protein